MSRLLRTPRQTPIQPPNYNQLIGGPTAFLGTDSSKNAAYYNGVTYIGYINGAGEARVSAYNHTTRALTTSPAIVTGLGADVHCSPSVLVRSSDHKIVVAVAPHNDAHLYVAISSSAESVAAFAAATDINSTLGGTKYTYANLFQLSGESGKIYLFYRDQLADTTNVLTYSTSTDGGSTWAAQTALYENSLKQSYWVVDSDSASRIDFLVSDGTAANGDTASLYHFYYDGSRRKSDGTVISASLPLGPSNLTKIYDGATNGSVRVPYSVVTGSPAGAWAAYDPAGSGSNEKYWYGIYTGGSWTVNSIVDSGTPPVTGFSEGGLAVDRISNSIVYVSRVTSSQWQIFRYSTANNGSSWSNTQLTSDADLNLRPVTPRDAVSGLRCLWCFGPHFLSAASVETFSSLIRTHPHPAFNI